MADAYLGTSYPVPTDSSYYLGQTGLSSLVPSAYTANSLGALFSPQGMQFTSANAQATNPFEQLFMQSAQDATKLQRKQVPGMQQQQAQNTPGQQQAWF